MNEEMRQTVRLLAVVLATALAVGLTASSAAAHPTPSSSRRSARGGLNAAERQQDKAVRVCLAGELHHDTANLPDGASACP